MRSWAWPAARASDGCDFTSSPTIATNEDWQRGATAEIRELEAAGRQVRKVPVGIEALAA
jgi:hypothetical protein